jgi:hypothetical protein
VPVLQKIVGASKWMFDLLKNLMSDFLTIIKNTLGFIVNIFTGNFTQAWENIKEIFSAVKTAEFLKEPFMAFFDWLNNAWEGIIERIQGLIDKIKSIKNKIPFLGVDDDEKTEQTGATISAATKARPEMVTAMRGVPQNNLQQNVTIEIKTDNPEQAGAAVRDNLNRQMKDAQTQFKKGGR